MKVSKRSGPRVLPESGIQLAVCYSIIELGTQKTSYKGVEKQTPQVQFSWELPNSLHVFDETKGKQCLSVHQIYSLTDTDKSKLPKALQTWGGQEKKPVISTELIRKYLGAPCMVTIEITAPNAEGNQYANISGGGIGIAKRMKEFLVPEVYPRNPKVFFDLEAPDWKEFAKIPQWIQKKIQECAEWPSVIKKFPIPASLNPNKEIHSQPTETIEEEETFDVGGQGEDPAF